MKKDVFIELMEEYLYQTGMSEGVYNNSFFSVDDKKNINTTIYVDEDNYIWLTSNHSVKRVKTSINVDNIVEFRYGQFGSDEGEFFVICNDDAGLHFLEGKIYYILPNGYYGTYQEAIEYFEQENSNASSSSEKETETEKTGA